MISQLLKRYTITEMMAGAIGVAFALFGMYAVFFPSVMAFYSPATAEGGVHGGGNIRTVELETLVPWIWTRLFGVTAFLVGAGLVWLSLFFRPKKKMKWFVESLLCLI